MPRGVGVRVPLSAQTRQSSTKVSRFLRLKGLDNLWRLGRLVFPLLAIASQFCVICATESLKTSFQTLYPKFHQPMVAPASFGHLSAAAVVRVRYNLASEVHSQKLLSEIANNI